MVSIKLKQYKPYATKTLTVKTNEDGSQTATVKQARESTKKLPTAYKVMAGQTLWEICKGKLGDGSRWQEIAKLNNIINPNSLDIGKVIKFG
jgi:nucleoid-associated protein YgaU